MYISLLDYLEEIKKKFYVIILMFFLFITFSLGYKFYKDNHYELSISKNLGKLSSLTLENYNVQATTEVAIGWIAEEATRNYNEANKIEHLIMKCKKENTFLNCQIKGKIKNDAKLNEVKNAMHQVMSDAFDDYKIYVLNLIDEIIFYKKDLFNFVESSNNSDIEISAEYNSAVKEILFTKNLFLDLMNRAKFLENDITITKTETKINYILIILSSLISGLFLIFLQMTSKKKLD